MAMKLHNLKLKAQGFDALLPQLLHGMLFWLDGFLGRAQIRRLFSLLKNWRVGRFEKKNSQKLTQPMANL